VICSEHSEELLLAITALGRCAIAAEVIFRILFGILAEILDQFLSFFDHFWKELDLWTGFRDFWR
jgi:hypothetical protein